MIKYYSEQHRERVKNQHKRDEVTHQKIEKHLYDKNDRITDEDIRNIKILLHGRHVEDPHSELKKLIR